MIFQATRETAPLRLDRSLADLPCVNLNQLLKPLLKWHHQLGIQTMLSLCDFGKTSFISSTHAGAGKGKEAGRPTVEA